MPTSIQSPDLVNLIIQLIDKVGVWNALFALFGITIILSIGFALFKFTGFLFRLPKLNLEKKQASLQEEQIKHLSVAIQEYQSNYKFLTSAFERLASNLQIIVSEKRLETQLNYLLGGQKDFGSLLKYKVLSFVENGLSLSVNELKKEIHNLFDSIILRSLENVAMGNSAFMEAIEEYARSRVVLFIDLALSKISNDEKEFNCIRDFSREVDMSFADLAGYRDFINGSEGVDELISSLKEFIMDQYRAFIVRDRSLNYLKIVHSD